MPEFRKAAPARPRLERSEFVRSENNWPDFRSRGRIRIQLVPAHPAWGASRLGCLSLEQDLEFRGEIEAAIEWMLRAGPVPQDHLCCGELGNLELLLEAGRRMARADWVEQAQIRGSAVIARAGRNADFQSECRALRGR